MEILQSFKNKNALQNTDICSCYACAKTFSPNDIKEWTDNYLTAICPNCNIDAILPMKVEELELKKLQEYWYGGKLHSDPSSPGK